LDALNFFLADVQTGLGPFLAIYLAGYRWDEQRIGLALTVGGLAGILSQAPAGGLLDRLRAKRGLIATGSPCWRRERCSSPWRRASGRSSRRRC
jgi:MFS family permease